MITNTAFVWIVCINIIVAIIYDMKNSSKIFEFYKDKYHKVYKNRTYEAKAFKNFVENLNKVTLLNEGNKINNTIIVLNKYADIDTEDFEEHYGLRLIPYENEVLYRNPDMYNTQSEGLRNRIEVKPDDNLSIEGDDLYDLDDADRLYKNYMHQYKKKNATREYDRMVQYYRFIKTLVELNREHYKGDETRHLDENADVVKKPFDYYYK